MKQTARIISIHAADTSGVCSMLYELGGLVIVPLVSLFSRKPPKELVDGSFACYEKTAVVPQATALGAETQK